jgi:hypothetical protein
MLLIVQVIKVKSPWLLAKSPRDYAHRPYLILDPFFPLRFNVIPDRILLHMVQIAHQETSFPPRQAFYGMSNSSNFLRSTVWILLEFSEKGWQFLLICLMASSLFQLWETRKNVTTKVQIIQDQANWQSYVPILSSRTRSWLKTGLLFETQTKSCGWHTKKTDKVHSIVKVATTQAKLKTHQIQQLFQHHCVLWSQVSTATHPQPSATAPLALPALHFKLLQLPQYFDFPDQGPCQSAPSTPLIHLPHQSFSLSRNVHL